MCEPVTIIAGVGMAVSAAATMAQQSTAAKNAKNAASAANAASLKQSSAEYKNQENTMRWQDETWQQDINFATQNLDYQTREFAKQTAYVKEAGTAIVKNEDGNLAQLALRSVQQNIATSLQEANTNTAAAEAGATAQVSADKRGVSGNSVNAIIDDVHRKQGQTIDVMEMNRSAMMGQTMVDMTAAKAAADSQLGQLQGSVKTFAPSTPIRTPQPVGTVQSPTLVAPAERSALGDALAIGGSAIQGGLTAFNTYNTVTGQTAVQGAGQIKSSLGIT